MLKPEYANVFTLYFNKVEDLTKASIVFVLANTEIDLPCLHAEDGGNIEMLINGDRNYYLTFLSKNTEMEEELNKLDNSINEIIDTIPPISKAFEKDTERTVVFSILDTFSKDDDGIYVEYKTPDMEYSELITVNEPSETVVSYNVTKREIKDYLKNKYKPTQNLPDAIFDIVFNKYINGIQEWADALDRMPC